MDTSVEFESTIVEAIGGFAALADGTRMRILQRLGAGPSCVCDLLADVPVPPNLLSYHLKVLRDAGLVIATRRGRWVDYALDRDGLVRLQAAVPLPVETYVGPEALEAEPAEPASLAGAARRHRSEVSLSAPNPNCSIAPEVPNG
jgi:ArsR family transcriptional regulator